MASLARLVSSRAVIGSRAAFHSARLISPLPWSAASASSSSSSARMRAYKSGTPSSAAPALPGSRGARDRVARRARHERPGSAARGAERSPQHGGTRSPRPLGAPAAEPAPGRSRSSGWPDRTGSSTAQGSSLLRSSPPVRGPRLPGPLPYRLRDLAVDRMLEAARAPASHGGGLQVRLGRDSRGARPRRVDRWGSER